MIVSTNLLCEFFVLIVEIFYLQLSFQTFLDYFLFFLQSLDKSEPKKEKDEGMTEAEMLHEEMSEGEYDEILDEIKTKKKRKKRLNLHSTHKSNT